MKRIAILAAIIVVVVSGCTQQVDLYPGELSRTFSEKNIFIDSAKLLSCGADTYQLEVTGRIYRTNGFEAINCDFETPSGDRLLGLSEKKHANETAASAFSQQPTFSRSNKNPQMCCQRVKEQSGEPLSPKSCVTIPLPADLSATCPLSTP